MRVGLCTPCRDGKVHWQYMMSVVETLKLASHSGVEVRHYVAPGCAVVSFVRNVLVAKALSEQCDWIVFVDDDIAWHAPDLFRLIHHGCEVVGAAPSKRHKRWDETPAAVVKWSDDPVIGRTTKAGRIWRVPGLATAFLAIRASVFERLESVTHPFVTEGNPMVARTWFWHDIVPIAGAPTGEGEDYNFCRKWIEAGGECWVDPDIRLRHYDGNVCHDVCLADMEVKQEEEAA